MSCPTCQADEAIWAAREAKLREDVEVREEAFRLLVAEHRIWDEAVESCARNIEGEACATRCKCRSCDFLNMLAADLRQLKGGPR